MTKSETYISLGARAVLEGLDSLQHECQNYGCDDTVTAQDLSEYLDAPVQEIQAALSELNHAGRVKCISTWQVVAHD